MILIEHSWKIIGEVKMKILTRTAFCMEVDHSYTGWDGDSRGCIYISNVALCIHKASVWGSTLTASVTVPGHHLGVMSMSQTWLFISEASDEKSSNSSLG